MCVECATRILQGRQGRAITLLNEWASVISIVWRILPYAAASFDGWSVGLQLPRPLESTDFQIYSGALELTGVSNRREYFTFTPKRSAPMWNVTTQPKKIYITIQFINVPQNDKESILSFRYYFVVLLCGNV